MFTANETLLKTEEGEDYEEKIAREKLKKWQARQVDKALIDNSINKVLENYSSPSIFHTMDGPKIELFFDNDMENILSRSQPFYKEDSSRDVHLATLSSTGDLEKYYGLDSEQQKAFVERIVAEALRKKTSAI